MLFSIQVLHCCSSMWVAHLFMTLETHSISLPIMSPYYYYMYMSTPGVHVKESTFWVLTSCLQKIEDDDDEEEEEDEGISASMNETSTPLLLSHAHTSSLIAFNDGLKGGAYSRVSRPVNTSWSLSILAPQLLSGSPVPSKLTSSSTLLFSPLFVFFTEGQFQSNATAPPPFLSGGNVPERNGD